MQQKRKVSTPWAAGPVVALSVVFVLGAALALLGSYWDDAWHTNRGRDEFLIAPHLALYVGVLVAGGTLALWGSWVLLREGRAALGGGGPLTLAVLGVAATLGSAPIDNAWHVAFGRDAVIWSPPHVLGIVGLVCLAVAMLALLGRVETTRIDVPRSLVSGLVLGGAVFLVAEYETDVPQFDEVYYLPVLATAAAVALELVRLIVGGRWPASIAALAHLGLILLVSGFLALATGWEAPLIPLLLGAALALDLAGARGWGPMARAAAFVGTLFLLYVPYLDLIGTGVDLDAADVAVGLPVSFTAVAVLFTAIARRQGPPPRRPPTCKPRAASLALMLMLLLAPGAAAHDPGQGESAGTMAFRLQSFAGRASLEARILGRRSCGDLEATALVARRAGEEIRAPLAKSGCGLRGSVAVPDSGRWFIYTELRGGERTLESWLPIEVGPGRATAEDRSRSLYVLDESAASTAQVVAAVGLYGLCLVLLGMVFRLASRQRPDRGGQAES